MSIEVTNITTIQITTVEKKENESQITPKSINELRAYFAIKQMFDCDDINVKSQVFIRDIENEDESEKLKKLLDRTECELYEARAQIESLINAQETLQRRIAELLAENEVKNK